MSIVIHEIIDVPMSHVVAITDTGFTIRVKKLFGWKEREFLYLWFSQVGGPLSRNPMVIGQHTDTGTLLRFYCDAETPQEHQRQLEVLIKVICRRIAEAVKLKQQAAQDLAEGKLTDEEREAMRWMFGDE